MEKLKNLTKYKYLQRAMIATLIFAVLVSCSKLSQAGQCEITITPEIDVMETRGYVQGTTMSNTEDEESRVIYLSAYDMTDSKDYLVGNTFKKDGAKWRNYEAGTFNPKCWPIEHSVRFLAYSAASSSPMAVWNPTNATSGIDLYIEEDGLQDDILIASTGEMKNSLNPVDMKFNHIQSWIEIEIRADMPSAVNIENITFADIYNSGCFHIDNRANAIVGKWDFSEKKPTDYKVVPSGTTTITSKTDRVCVSMLMPAQSAQEFVINYTTNGVEKNVVVENKISTWMMGTHYIYKIIITPLLTKSGANASTASNVEVELLQKSWK